MAKATKSKAAKFEFAFSPSKPIQIDESSEGIWLRLCTPMQARQLGTFETPQCKVEVYKTFSRFERNVVYALKSVHKNNGKEIVRFGNKTQIQAILDAYTIVRGERVRL